MCGIDYSLPSIQLSRKLGQEIGFGCSEIEFEVCDVIRDDWERNDWWPKSEANPSQAAGWDIILDKGTFDAISLSAETIDVPMSPTPQKLCEIYPTQTTRMLKPGGFLLITSCNWTQDEVIHWFTSSSPVVEEDQDKPKLEVFAKLKYTSFKFGGAEGTGVCTVCFRRVR